mmetsp:Transcript_6524/g.18733  ORF Transcript_6524/g.18733 Transcript_6524/m.18733 type:complete len:318 (+) Transcript_6524:766-1719(+)
MGNTALDPGCCSGDRSTARVVDPFVDHVVARVVGAGDVAGDDNDGPSRRNCTGAAHLSDHRNSAAVDRSTKTTPAGNRRIGDSYRDRDIRTDPMMMMMRLLLPLAHHRTGHDTVNANHRSDGLARAGKHAACSSHYSHYSRYSHSQYLRSSSHSGCWLGEASCHTHETWAAEKDEPQQHRGSLRLLPSIHEDRAQRRDLRCASVPEGNAAAAAAVAHKHRHSSFPFDCCVHDPLPPQTSQRQLCLSISGWWYRKRNGVVAVAGGVVDLDVHYQKPKQTTIEPLDRSTGSCPPLHARHCCCWLMGVGVSTRLLEPHEH